MIRFARFLPGDAHALFAAQGMDAHAAAVERAGRFGRRAFSLLNAGAVRAVGGVVDVHEGVAELWSFRAHDMSHGELFAFARFCKRFVASEPSRRLQATARADCRAAVNFLDWLGMLQEGTLRAFDPSGADHIQYARVREGER